MDILWCIHSLEFNSFSSRWRKGPTEFITVDDLKFYRRRWPPGKHVLSALLRFYSIIFAHFTFRFVAFSFFSPNTLLHLILFYHQNVRIFRLNLLLRYPDINTTTTTQNHHHHHHNQQTTDQLHHTINTAPTSSSFSLYNKSEPYVPFSALKTEYQRQYCGIGSTIPPRATLRRRSTSLKLPARERLAATKAGDIGAADLLDLTMGESEQHAEYHPYTEDEQSQCVCNLFPVTI